MLAITCADSSSLSQQEGANAAGYTAYWQHAEPKLNSTAVYTIPYSVPYSVPYCTVHAGEHKLKTFTCSSLPGLADQLERKTPLLLGPLCLLQHPLVMFSFDVKALVLLYQGCFVDPDENGVWQCWPHDCHDPACKCISCGAVACDQPEVKCDACNLCLSVMHAMYAGLWVRS